MLGYGMLSSQTNPADIVSRSRSVILSFSGVRRSAYSGNNENTEAARSFSQPRSKAMPTASEVMLLLIDRSSCAMDAS
jgi:hypothetical protein